ncbi:hypothetical protein [Nocardioides sp. YIM 152588]|uniref:hypothetical protein n=1 Tax=Nocardioides sp. YIM 152588 TaxID=3158259 RepID=UPI0032E5315A
MGRSRSVLWGLIFVAVLVNLPIGHHLWSEFRLSRSGVETTAEVVHANVLEGGDGPRYVLQFRYDDELDPEQQLWPVEVDRAAFASAEASGEVDVRSVPGRPATFSVEGETGTATGWVVLLVIDVMLVLLVVLLWRARRLGRWSADGEEDPEDPDQARPF